MQAKTDVHSVSMMVVGVASLEVDAAKTVGFTCRRLPCNVLDVNGEPACGVGTTGSSLVILWCKRWFVYFYGNAESINTNVYIHTFNTN